MFRLKKFCPLPFSKYDVICEWLPKDRVAISFTVRIEPWTSLSSWWPSNTDWGPLDFCREEIAHSILDCMIKGELRDHLAWPHLFQIRSTFLHLWIAPKGSSSDFLYGPYRAMNESIVLVTINYRLGPFGFLSGGDCPLNIGLHDQRWA